MRNIVTNNFDSVEIELDQWNKESRHSMFMVTFVSFTRTKIYLSGDLIEALYREAKMLINEREYPCAK